MTKNRRRARGALAATLSLVVLVGCGSDTDSDGTGPGTSGTESDEITLVDSSGPATGETSTSPDPDPDVETVPGEATPTSTRAMELTASDTGVTSDAIKLGVVFPDTTLLGREPGDLEAKWQVVIDDVNASGGINGRRIDMVFTAYNPIGDEGSDATCVRNTADEKVFAVVGLLVRESALCYTELNDTIAVSTFPATVEQVERSSAPLITMEPISARLVGDKVATLLESGDLADGMKVAVHGIAAQEALHDAYIAALEEAGIDVVAATVRTSPSNDIAASTAEVAVFAERWISSDAEAVLGSAPESAIDFIGVYNDAGLDLPMLLPEATSTTPSLIQDFLGYSLEPFQYATALIAGDEPGAMFDQGLYGVEECITRFEEATGEDVTIGSTVEDGDNLNPTVMACQTIEVFSQVAAAAGADLTTESFAQAAIEFGPITVTAIAAGSLGPDKFDIADVEPVVGRWNPESALFEG